MKTLKNLLFLGIALLMSTVSGRAQGTPMITINGPCFTVLPIHSSYIEAGYLAKDTGGADVTSQAVVTGSVNTNQEGRYELTYCITSAGITKCTKRIVLVSQFGYQGSGGTLNDSIKVPVFFNTAVIQNRFNYYKNTLGLTISGGSQSVFDSSNVGTYIIMYYISDAACGLVSLALRVKVVDITAPVVTLKGTDSMCVTLNSGFSDPFVSVTDNYWDVATISIIRKGIVNTNVAGYYYLTYIATDPSGNKDSITRVVKVGDCASGLPTNDPASFKIYPNPAGDFINIEATVNNQPIKNIRIFDYQGKLCLDQQMNEMNNSPSQLKINTLSPGMYLLKIESDYGAHIQKIMISR